MTTKEKEKTKALEKGLDVQLGEMRASIKKLFAMMTEVNQKISLLKGSMVNAGVIKMDAQFDAAKPAPDHRTILVRKMFAMAKEADVKEDGLKNTIKSMWKIESTKEMTVEQLGVVLKMLEGRIEQRKKGRQS